MGGVEAKRVSSFLGIKILNLSIITDVVHFNFSLLPVPLRLERLGYLCQGNQFISYKGRDKSPSHYVDGSSTRMLQSALTRAHNEVST